MSQLIKNGAEFVELKDDGTHVRHRVRFLHDISGISLRIDRDTQGKETPSILYPKSILTIDSTTGDILKEKRGTSEKDEVLGLPPHPEAGREFVAVNDKDRPSGYDRKTYKYSKSTRKIIKK